MTGGAAGGGEAIAVVGMSGRFPGAASVAELWRNLRAGVSGVRPLTDQELAAAGVGAAERDDPRYVRMAGVLSGADLFDAGLFGLTPREAEVMDPQLRVFLECAWEALEDAGHDPERFPGWIGVYAGAALGKYLWLNVGRHPEALAAVGTFQAMITNDKDFLATQVSYRLNLRGPSLGVQSACSTSLVAVHLACQALLCFECDMALAGGVSISLPEQGYLYQDDGLASPDGVCRPFDARAAGTIRSNGAGVVALRRLGDALADGDRVLALVRGSAINNDGAAKVGFTAPSVGGQAEVIAVAQAVAGVSAESIGYVEAHGTGTPLGDPIEVAALTQAFGAAAARRARCALGSIKSNLGHLDAAAGVAGFIKTVLALHHGELPPSLHFATPNPQIDFAASPFYVNAELRPWPPGEPGETPRRAGVSAFGIGGTNAHVVLEEAPPAAAVPAPAAAEAAPEILLLSAQSETALRTAAARLAAHDSEDLPAIACTLQLGRRALAWRWSAVVRSTEEARRRLHQLARGEAAAVAVARELPAVALVFPGPAAVLAGAGAGAGAGADADAGRAGMAGLAAELYRTRAVFRAVVEEGCALLAPELGDAVRREIAAGPASGDVRVTGPASAVAAEAAAPALFLSQLALARLWLSWGVEPAALYGYDGGEEVAACVAEVLPLAAALELAVLRGRLAAGGERAAILAAVRGLVAVARPQAPRIRMVSSVTGDWAGWEDLADLAYWVELLAAPADTAAGLALLRDEPARVLVEIGPRGGAVAQLLATAGELWRAGVALRWEAVHERRRPRRAALPTYPFERQRYYLEPQVPAGGAAMPPALGSGTEQVGSGGGRRPLAEWFHLASWKRSLPPPPGEEPAATERRCLVLLDDRGVGAALAAALRRDGWQVTEAAAGAAWQQGSDGRYVLRPGDEEDFRRLWRALAGDVGIGGGGLPRRVVHLWNLGGDSPEPGLDAALDRSFYSLLHLAGRFAAHPGAAVELTVVSDRLHAVDGGDRPHPERAALLGTCRVLPQELEHVSCRSLDLDVAGGVEQAAALCLAELAAPAAEPVVAWRGPYRWLPSWEAVPLADAAPGAGLRPGGVYVVTGGLGGVGLEVAELLAAGGARLVLVGRTPLPPRETWDAWLPAHPAGDATSARIRRLQAIEARGTALLLAAGDVTDRGQMAAVRDAARQRFGAVHGVFHAAGIAGGGLLATRTREQAAAVLAPKVAGTRVVAEVFGAVAGEAGEAGALDLLVLFSSLNALTGGIGQADYAAANAFQDAFAAAAAAAPATPPITGRTRVVSINWDAWQGAGMASAADLPAELQAWRAAQLAEAIEPAEGRAALARILAADLVRVAVATDDLDERLRAAASLRLSAALALAAAAAPPHRNPHPRPAVAPAYVPPETPDEELLAGLWQELLGIAPIGRDDGFFELGGHSLLAGQLAARIRQQVGIDLPLQAVFAHPTPARLAVAMRDGSDGGDRGDGGEDHQGGAVGAAPVLAPRPRIGRRVPFPGAFE